VVSYFFAFAGQSNARRHFTDSSPTGADVFAADIGALTGATSVTTLNTAVGGSASDQLSQNALSEQKYWYDLNDGLPGPLLVDAVANIKAAGQPITGIIWSQGEQDAASLVGDTAVQITVDHYVAATQAIFDYFRAELGDADLPIYIQELGATTRVWEHGFDEIRAAQIEIAQADPDVHIAAVTYDLPLNDTVHYTGSGYQTAAHRLAQFVAEDLGAASATYAHGPKMTSAALAGGDTQIVISIAHDGGTDFSPGNSIDGFLVADKAGFIVPTSVERISPTQIRLSFAEALAGDVTVWYIRDGNGWDLDDVVRDNSPLALPLEPGVVTAAAAADVDVVKAADFDGGTDGFSYLDNTFLGTSASAYASGSAQPHGALEVRLGGIDGVDTVGMSGGWSTSFNVAQASNVTVSLRYHLTISGSYDPDEFSQVLVSVDGQLAGVGGNNYVAQLVGDGGGDPDQSTGWQAARVDLGYLAPGQHTLVIGGYNNKKTTTSEETTLLLDDVVVSSPPGGGAPPPAVVFSTNFNAGSDGFVYVDDAFFATAQPLYASWQLPASGGPDGSGAAAITLGGVDGNDIVNMSGAWTKAFALSQAGSTSVTFDFKLDIASAYEPDEFTQVLVAIDGQLKGLNGNDYVAQLFGKSGPTSTGWQTVTVDLGDLAAGNHTVSLGGFNNKKTTASEVSEIRFDDVSVAVEGSAPPPGPVNGVPDAVADTAATTEDAAVTLSVLGNDSDPDGDLLNIAAIDTSATKGWVTISGNSIVYNPGGAFDHLAAGQSENDTFAYTISDGNGGMDTATVTVTVSGAAGDGVTVTVGSNATLLSTGGDVAVPGVSNPSTLNSSDLGFLDGGNTSRAWLGELTSRLGGNSINAVSVMDDGTIVFAAAAAGTLAGVGAFTTSDLIAWDIKTDSFGLFFEGSSHGLALGIDAVHVNDDGSFYFSVADSGAIVTPEWPVAAGDVRGNQIWQYDPSAAGAEKFALTFDGNGEGLSSLPNENIDALFVHDNGTAVISVSGSGGVLDSSLNPLSFSDSDLVSFDLEEGNGTFALLVDGDAIGYDTGAGDIKALHLFDATAAASGANAVGGAGNDTLIGDNQANVLSGGGGNDLLFGGGGVDMLFGGDGEDILYSSQGNDTLTGGRGADVMHGDAGGQFSNTFVYTDLDEGGDTVFTFDLHSSASETNADFVDLSNLFAGVPGVSGMDAQDLIDGGYITLATGDWNQDTGIFTDGAGSDARLSISVNTAGEIDPVGTGEVLLAAFVDRGDTLSATDILVDTLLV
jgi:VCBS repeat-containing protein